MANKNPGFRALTIKHNGMANRIITEIGVTPPFEMSQIIDNKLPYEVITKQALWDTGATNSVITPETARQLNLTPVGAREVIHFGGKKQSNTHLLNFILPNNVVTPGILVTESDDIINDFGVIIGMDIIARGDFSITNVRNQTWMSYRIPSINAIDYVVEHNRILYSGYDKYGPCFCGNKDENGRPMKFKNCHGKDL